MVEAKSDAKRIAELAPSARSSALVMLKDTALDVYAPHLAQLEHEILGDQQA